MKYIDVMEILCDLAEVENADHADDLDEALQAKLGLSNILGAEVGDIIHHLDKKGYITTAIERYHRHVRG